MTVTFAEAVRHAAPTALLAALAHHTGDLSILRDDLRPDATGAQTREQRRATRELCVEVWERAGEQPPATDPVDLRPMLSFLTGVDAGDDALALLQEQLEPTPIAPIRSDRPLLAGIIGAGLSGLAVAHRLREAGVDVVVFEKNADVGGTWFENTYPGARVDVPNHVYSYTWDRRLDWPQRFSPQPLVLDYFRRCADDLDLRPSIRFGTAVEAATFDDATGGWDLGLSTGERVRVDVLVSCTGQLNRPRLPDIPGRETFAGPAFHSARWDHSVDLRGKRVAVVGTAASGFQLIPEVAEAAAETVVFQRTPNWTMPTPDYHQDVPEGMQWLLRSVPRYAAWYRAWLFWALVEGVLPAARTDDLSANDALRGFLTAYLEEQFADRPDLVPLVVPAYPPLAKRMLLDDGLWPRTLKRDDVRLVTERIAAIDAGGVRTADGTHHDVDVLVFATGFRADEFLAPMSVRGRGGVDLHALWDGEPRAHLGLTVPGFPNLFVLYGPNTNLVVNGSIFFMSECGANFVVEAVRRLAGAPGARTIEVTAEAYERFGREVDDEHSHLVWAVADVNTWYRNANGRATQTWPFSLVEYWRRTRAPEPGEYVVS